MQDSAILSPRKRAIRDALCNVRVVPAIARFTNYHNGDELLTPSQLAQRLQVPVSWVYEQTRNRASVRDKRPLPHIRMGKYLRFGWSDVVRWLQEKEIKAA